MKRLIGRGVAFAVCAALAVWTAQAARPAGAGRRAGPGGPPHGLGPPADEAEDLQETLEIYMIAKLKRALSLSRDQEEKLVPLVQDLSEQRRAFNRSRRLALMALGPLAEDPASSEEEIRRVLARLEESERGFRGREARTLEDIRALLSPRQQAQFVVFQERFRAEMQQRLRRLRQMEPPGRRGAGPAPPPPGLDE